MKKTLISKIIWKLMILTGNVWSMIYATVFPSVLIPGKCLLKTDKTIFTKWLRLRNSSCFLWRAFMHMVSISLKSLYTLVKEFATVAFNKFMDIHKVEWWTVLFLSNSFNISMNLLLISILNKNHYSFMLMVIQHTCNLKLTTTLCKIASFQMQPISDSLEVKWKFRQILHK
jgi:hypothetical protein